MFSIISCSSEQKENEYGANENLIFELVQSSHSNLNFENKIIETPAQNIFSFQYLYNGGGVGIGDINNDGLADIYFCGNQVPDKLYLNKGNLEFEDISLSAGIGMENIWSNGVNMFDINSDGWLDIYVCHGGPEQYPIKQNHLYINNQDGTFSEKSQEYGLVDEAFSSQSVAFDYDGDGDLDLFVGSHNNFKKLKTHKGKLLNEATRLLRTEQLMNLKENQKKHNNILFENQGNNTFISVPTVLNKWGHCLGISVSDFNKDNKPDLFVANDYEIPDFLYYNQGKAEFKDVNKEKFKYNSQFSMGCDAADLNNDGWPDLVVADMTAKDRIRNKTLMAPMREGFYKHLIFEKEYQKQFMFNVMQVNNTNGTFKDISQMTSTSQTDWSWAALLADFDLDGDKDYFITNGFKRDTKNRDVAGELRKDTTDKSKLAQFNKLKKFPSVPLANYMFENEDNLEFNDVTKEWNLTDLSFSNGAAYADLDNDGDLELVINNIDNKPFLYKNLSIEKSKGQYLQIKFDSNPLHIGCKLTLYTNRGIQFLEFNPVRGFWSSVDQVLHFGINAEDSIDSLHLEWLNGNVFTYRDLKANTKIEVDQIGESNKNKDVATQTLFERNAKMEGQINFKHEENDFWDFDYETLLPHKVSNLGPNISCGDINKDNLTDFFIGGSQGYSPAIFIQNKQGGFTKQNDDSFEEHRYSEDIGSEFFDFDNDGDLDLYVVSGGGGEFSSNDSKLKDRFYENVNGRFQLNQNVFDEELFSSGSKVKACDYDDDGDLDLFVGGRLIPRKYPSPGTSILWENKDGKFVNMTSEYAPELEEIGMVTDFEWVDLNQDDKMDLIIVGEWMNIEVFLQQENKYVRQTKEFGLEDTRGWWLSIEKSDIENDGDIDFIVGNLGLNNKFHASKTKPLQIYFNDFDNNGTGDIVLAKMDEGEQYILRGKDCSSEQMPFLRQKYSSYENFAKANISEVLSEEKLNSSLSYTITDFSSIILRNNNGRFDIEYLPRTAQISPIQDIITMKINDDEYEDLIIAGNLFETEIETPSYASGVGMVYFGSAEGFQSMDLSKSGLFLPTDVRDLDTINVKNQTYLMVASNNEQLQILKLNQ